MNGKNIGYWITTGLVALAFLSGGVMDASRNADVQAGMSHLGYPLYFALILGVWKFLGGVAILAPGFARLKEWAYAGMAFDLTGATFSHAASGDGAGKIITPLVILAIVATSWALRPASRKLASNTSESKSNARVPGVAQPA
ncbi:MAG: DoxX family protein [Deltaproteobacteria bacterium]|nr:DoxX family protein [Deltaproteobacteria bacterium]